MQTGQKAVTAQGPGSADGRGQEGSGHLEGGLGWGQSWRDTDASRINWSRKETAVNSRWERAELRLPENSEGGTAEEGAAGLTFVAPMPNSWVRGCLGSLQAWGLLPWWSWLQA